MYTLVNPNFTLVRCGGSLHGQVNIFWLHAVIRTSCITLQCGGTWR